MSLALTVLEVESLSHAVHENLDAKLTKLATREPHAGSLIEEASLWDGALGELVDGLDTVLPETGKLLRLAKEQWMNMMRDAHLVQTHGAEVPHQNPSGSLCNPDRSNHSISGH